MERSDTSAAPEAMPAPPRERELTARALIYGCVCGAMLSAGNVYTGLKTGFIDGGSITAALVAFAFFAMIKRFSPASFGARENNIAQTTAASAAIMGFAIGLSAAFPALKMLGWSYAPWVLSAWGLALGVIGIVVASKLRHKLIRVERLPFPTGAATAEVIETIGAARGTAMRRALLLIGTAVLAAAFAWFRDGRPAVIPQAWMLDVVVMGTALSSLTVGMSWSPLMIATGMLMGEHAAFSMLAGGIVAWIGLAPRLVHAGIVGGASFSDCNKWLIWPGVGMLLAGSFVPLLFDWRGIVRSFRDLAGLLTQRGRDAAAPRDENASMPASTPLLVGSFALVLVLGVGVFHVGVLVPVVGLVLALVLTNVCGRTAGETDMAPTGAFGTLTQLTLSGNGLQGSIVGGSIVSGAAAQASQTLWALKAGDRLGSSPRAQLKAQLLGCLVGSVTSVPVYFIIVKAYGINTVAMPATAAQSWRATAEAVQHGLAAMPPYSALAGAIGFGLGVVFAILLRTRFGRFVPSPAAMGMAIVTPFSLSMAMCVGGIIVHMGKRLRPGSSDANLMAIAAGGIAGESVMGVIIAGLIASGVLTPM